jgi:hypothetical protein
MSKPISKFLARHDRIPGGIATGGGETGFYSQPQEHVWTVALWGSAGYFKDILLPAGTVVTGYFVIPFNGPDDGSGGGVPATGGTVAIDQWSALPPPANQAGGSSVASWLPSTPANAYSSFALAAPVVQAADIRVRFRVLTNITPLVTPGTSGFGGAGAVLVGLEAFMPRMRP